MANVIAHAVGTGLLLREALSLQRPRPRVRAPMRSCPKPRLPPLNHRRLNYNRRTYA